MNYEEAIAYFNEPRWQKVSLGLERISLLLELLGNPQDRFKTIHVAGTNGKGSTCSYLDSIVRCSGFKCGLFTSPYIERFEERIQVDGHSISVEDLIAVTLEVKSKAEEVEALLGEHPTEFELMCAAGFLHFADSACDFVVCEVGLGGRLDATNVVDPEICVIARIGLDHTDILGDTIADIAMEKAGIIKDGVPVVSWPQEADAMLVIEDVCKEKGCDLCVSDFFKLSLGGMSDRLSARTFTYKGVRYSTHMVADYQARNAAIAIDAAEAMRKLGFSEITLESIQHGIQCARWPGRFEVLGFKPLFIMDGAHNPQGAQSLREALESLGIGNGEGIVLICGMLADKDCEAALEAMMPLAKSFYAYRPDSMRALSSEELARLASSVANGLGMDMDVRCFDTPGEAVHAALEKESPEGTIVSFGTLYSLSDVRKAYTEA